MTKQTFLKFETSSFPLLSRPLARQREQTIPTVLSPGIEEKVMESLYRAMWQTRSVSLIKGSIVVRHSEDSPNLSTTHATILYSRQAKA